MTGPWLKFYPSDWRADPALRMCSIAARGLWMEMLCVMHEAEPRGTLRVNGKALSDRQLGALAGCADVSGLLSELEEAGVFSRDEDGTVFSRRMMRDDAKAKEDKANGKRGGNPGLIGGVNPPAKSGDKAQNPEAKKLSGIGATAPISPEPAKAAPSVVGLPTVSDGDYPVSEADIAEWQPAFPAVDVRQQLAAMRQWLIANPNRRKTKRGMRKFVVSWLDRKQNSAPSVTAHRATAPPLKGAVAQYRQMLSERDHEPPSRTIDHRNDELLPPNQPRLQALVGELGSAMRWPDGSGNH